MNAAVNLSERHTAHRAKMAMKKARRGTIRTGFTYVPNGRLEAAHAATVLVLIEQDEARKPMEPIGDYHSRAWRQIASTLPPERRVRSYIPKQSKSDDPLYRKAADR